AIAVSDRRGDARGTWAERRVSRQRHCFLNSARCTQPDQARPAACRTTAEGNPVNPVLAAEGGYQQFALHSGEWFVLIGSLLTALLAIAVGFFLTRGVLAADEGTPTMIQIAKAIQEGAIAYLKRQFRTIVLIIIPLIFVVFFTSVAVKRADGSEALPFGVSGLARPSALLLCSAAS